jgi:3-deoxy-D-manno-octulosonic-acid transferase
MPILPDNWKIIIAPHEIDNDHIQKLRQLLEQSTELFSELDAENTGHDKKILIINNIGMLSRLYAYGDIAFVGGGFQKAGIHNILEPAVFGVPAIFGPVYEKFVEAKELASLHYAFPINNIAEATGVLKKLVTDDAYRIGIRASLQRFMQEHTGATGIIMDEIEMRKWLVIHYPVKS